MVDAWALMPVRFRIQIGEKTLLQPRLPLLVLNEHFSRLPDDPAQIELPLDRIQGDTLGALVRSQPVREDLPHWSMHQGLIRYAPDQYDHYYVDISGTFADYAKKWNSKQRYTVTRYVKKFLVDGKVDWKEYRTPNELQEFYPLARSISRKTYQEKLLDAGLPEGEEFLKEMLDLGRSGMCRGYLLFHGGVAIAYMYVVQQADALISERLGYDPEFRKWGPGSVLHLQVLERLFAEQGPKMFDFAEGASQYKRYFATGVKRCADIFFLRRTPKVLSVVGSQYGFATATRNGVKLLDRFGLKERVKKFMRFGGAGEGGGAEAGGGEGD